MHHLKLSEEDRLSLEGVVRRCTAEQRFVRRASIVLELSRGLSLLDVALKLGIGRQQVALWRD